MKTLDEKAAEYAANVVDSFPELESYKGTIETVYGQGAIENKELSSGECGTFGQALESIKRGNLVTRKGWNGKGMFIFMRPADELHIEFVVKQIQSLPQGVKKYYHQDCVDDNGNPIKQEDDIVKFTSYLCMKAADGSIVNGWLASQSDMLSSDWMIFEF